MGFDLVSLGELLIDFTPVGVSEKGNPFFERNPGGGPANLACAAARLGDRVAFIGQVGADTFGRALRGVLLDNGVDVSRLRLSPDYQTSLAFVHLDPAGDRSFSFYRRQGADTMLRADAADEVLIADARVFFYSSVLMTGGDSRAASYRLAAYARQRGVATVFDPNLRLNLWDSEQDARACIQHAMQWADIVKVSGEELTFLTGEPCSPAAAKAFKTQYGLKALLVTLGPDGCLGLLGEDMVSLPALDVQVVDTTAAGDAFTGGFIHRLLAGDTDIMRRSAADFRAMLAYANAAGGLTTTRKGAICALPTSAEIDTALC